MLGSKLVFMRRTDAAAAKLVAGVLPLAEGGLGELAKPASLDASPEIAGEESR